MNFFEELLDDLIQWLSDIWDEIVKFAKYIWMHVEKLFSDLIELMKSKVKRYGNKDNLVGITIRIKDAMAKKEVSRIKGLRDTNNEVLMAVIYDENKQEIVDDVKDIDIIETPSLDPKTKEAFGKNSILIIE